MKPQNINGFGLIIALLVIICYAQFFTKSFTFEPFYSLYPDVSEAYFLHSINDPTLLTRDIFSVGFNKSLNHFNWDFFFAGIYKLLLNFFSLPVAMKIVSISLCMITTILVYRISAKLYTAEFAFFPSGLFLIYFLSKDTFFGGATRNVGIFLFCLFILYFENKKRYFLPLLSALSVLFYPYLFVPFVIICFLQFLNLNSDTFNKKLYLLWLVFNICLGLFFIIGKGAGKFLNVCLVNLPRMGAYKYTLRVNTPINPDSLVSMLLYFILNLNEHSKLHFYSTIFLLFLSFIIIVFRKKNALNLPKSLWLMLLGCAIGFFIIYPFQPVLASREFSFIIPFMLVLFVSSNVIKVIKNKLILYEILTIGVIVFLFLHPLHNSIRGYEKYKPVYDYIETLPKDTLIAGNPKSELIRTIPFFSKRAVFFAEKLELSNSVYSEEERFQRSQDLTEALYVGSLDKIRDFISQYKIDYFLIEENYYEKLFFNYLNSSIHPFDRMMRGFLNNKGHQDVFFFQEFAKKSYDFKIRIDNHEVIILSTEKLNALILKNENIIK